MQHDPQTTAQEMSLASIKLKNIINPMLQNRESRTYTASEASTQFSLCISVSSGILYNPTLPSLSIINITD